MGNPDFAIPTLEAIIKSNHELIGVVSNPPKHMGRGRTLSHTSVGKYSRDNDLTLLQPQNLKSIELKNQLIDLKPDVFVVVAYKILPEDIINIPQFGSLNLHASLLPKYRGPSPVQTAIINDEKISGTSIILLNETIDGGPIICQEKYKIKPEETYSEIIERLFLIGAESINKVLTNTDLISKARPQNEEEATHTKKMEKIDGHINWKQDGKKIIQIIKALSEKPGTYSFIDEKKIKIHKASNFEKSEFHNEPGELCLGHKDELYVSTLGGRITINELQLEGKKRMKAKDFIRGYKIFNEIKNERIYKKLS